MCNILFAMEEDFLSPYLTTMEKSVALAFQAFSSSETLEPADRRLLEQARAITAQAYAPYSRFQVGAAAMLANGKVVTGTNQENASYPVGICAERTLLSALSSIHPGVAVHTMAIAYHNLQGSSDRPVSPCGMCRQSLSEYQERTGNPIRLILSGMEGEVWLIHKASDLLPLSFGSQDLLGA